MIYKTKSFDNIYRLSEFLNDNKINPTDIVGIYREHKYQNQYCFNLLYIEQGRHKNADKLTEEERIDLIYSKNYF